MQLCIKVKLCIVCTKTTPGSSPHRLVLHDADGGGRAEDWSVVVLVCHEDPGCDGTPASLRRIRGLIRGPHHQEERRGRLAIQLLPQGQDSGGTVQEEQVGRVRPVVFDGVTDLAVGSTAVL